MTDKTSATYSGVSRLNHWIGAVLFAGLLTVGFILSYDVLPKEEASSVRALHKATGVLMLFFAIWRVSWRIGQGFPPPAADRAGWELGLSKVVHYSLLIALIAMPVSGITMSLFSGRPIDMYGVFEIPPIAEVRDIVKPMRQIHGLAAYALTGLILLHLAGALKHSLIDRDGTLRRMISGQTAA